MLKDVVRILRRENIHVMLLVVSAMILVSGAAIAWFEPGIDFFSGVWWSIVTLTTVGYGDISPTTTGGRVVAIIIMFFGIGLLGTLSANLAALLISRKMREDKGMVSARLTGHIIICEWNHRAKAIMRELRSDPKTSTRPIVLIADIPEKPLEDDYLVFIRGDVNEETLQRANLAEVDTVVILGDDRLNPTARDAKVVLITLTIETLNPRAYTVVELVDEANRKHCERANADEIIVGSEISSHLVASATIDHGISKVVSELLSARFGNELYIIDAPESMIGRSYMDVLVESKKRFNATLLGIKKGENGDILANPRGDLRIAQGDSLIVVAPERPIIP